MPESLSRKVALRLGGGERYLGGLKGGDVLLERLVPVPPVGLVHLRFRVEDLRFVVNGAGFDMCVIGLRV